MSRLDRSTLALVFALVLLPIGALAGFKALVRPPVLRLRGLHERLVRSVTRGPLAPLLATPLQAAGSVAGAKRER